MATGGGAGRGREEDDIAHSCSSLLASRVLVRAAKSSSLRDARASRATPASLAPVRQPAFAGLAASMMAAVPYHAPRPKTVVVASLSEASLGAGNAGAPSEQEAKPIDFSQSLSLRFLHPGSEREQAALRRGERRRLQPMRHERTSGLNGRSCSVASWPIAS